MKESQLGIDEAEISLTESKLGRLPSLNGQTNFWQSYGKRIDPSTNDFFNLQFGDQSLSVNGGITLFNGNRINNQINESNNLLKSNQLDLEQAPTVGKGSPTKK